MLAYRAGIVRGEEGADHELAQLDVAYFAANFLHDATVFVAHGHGLCDGLNTSIGPQIRAAHAGGGNAYDGIARLENLRVGAILEADVARP